MDTPASWKHVLLPRHALLRSVLELEAELEQRPSGQEKKATFDDIGLLFWDELGAYDSTPTNVISFATTGGGGTHYSLLPLTGREEEDWPVVMTVPMEFDNPNVVVGGSLREFLELGCFYGYFALEQLAYAGPTALASDLERAADPEDSWPEKRHVLAALRKRFSLQPWRNAERRLTELQRKYAPLLRVEVNG